MGTSKHRAGRTGGYGFAVPVALLLVSMMTTGCVPATVGFSVAYVKGNLESVVPAGSEETIAAAEATLEELDVTLTYSKHGDLKTVLIGRNPHKNSFALNDKRVSTTHCEIAVRAEGLVVIDKGAKNGIFLNDERIVESAPLSSGDTLAMGSTRIYVGLLG